jgi:small subunit ribosomal protein S9
MSIKKTEKSVKPEKVEKKKPVARKKKSEVVVSQVSVAPKALVSERYVYAIGRRKTSIARVRLYPISEEEKKVIVNNKSVREYFGTVALEGVALAPLKSAGLLDVFRVSIITRGGGLHGQAGAIKLGIARSLIKHDPLLRPTLKALGFLTRDARIVERKKPGLKKARRAPQWAKR